LTLLVTPVAYSLLDDAGATIARRRSQRESHPSEPASAAAVPIPSAGAGS
jgi:hypothetical protein